MKNIANIAIGVAVISLIASILSRLAMKPLAIIPGGLEAQALLAFTNTCLLFAVTVILLEIQKGK